MKEYLDCLEKLNTLVDKDERENLTTHVKLYGDVFESDSEILKLINKYLMETIGK